MSEVKPAYAGEEWPPAPNITQPMVPEPDLMPGKAAMALSGLGWALAIIVRIPGWSPGLLLLLLSFALSVMGFLVGLSGGRTWTAIVGRLMSLVLIILYLVPLLLPMW